MIGWVVIWSLVLVLPKMSECVTTFKDKDWNKDKSENNKLISFGVHDDKLLEKFKVVCGLRWKTCKILNQMLYRFMTTDM